MNMKDCAEAKSKPVPDMVHSGRHGRKEGTVYLAPTLTISRVSCSGFIRKDLIWMKKPSTD